MEQFSGGYTLSLCDGAFPLSTDSMVLAEFVKLPKNARVLDLGSGCGTLGILLCGAHSDCTVTGIELDARAHQTARENIRRNALDSRMSSICADLNDIRTLLPCGGFSCCVSNPPYFPSGPAGRLPAARREDRCTAEQLFAAAAWALRTGGDFFLVHRPERLAELCACADRAGFAPKRLRLVRHRLGASVALVLLQCRKGAKHGLIWEDASLYSSDAQPTEYYHKVYRS